MNVQGRSAVVLTALLACGAIDAQETSSEDGVLWIEAGNVAPVARDDDFSVARDNVLGVAAPGVLANDIDVDGDSLTARLVDGPSHGALELGPDGSFHYSPDAGFAGTDAFTYSVDDSLGTAAATARIEVGQQALLLTDTFSRPDSATVGNGWAEIEAAGASVGLEAGRMTFLDTSDAVARPMVQRRFAPVTTGSLTWEFEVDWSGALAESAYAVYMQLGDGAQMSAEAPDAGVGVNLVWTRIGIQDQMLGFRREGSATALRPMSGLRLVRVQVDVNRFSYDVYVDGALAGAAIPFDVPVALDTVRFVADVLNEQHFSGRSFDSVTISGSAPVARDAFVRAAGGAAKSISLPYAAGDGPGPYTFDVVAAPMHGTLGDDDGDASVIYTPHFGFVGEDSFTFRVSDGAGQSSVATVSLAVQHYPGATWETRTPAEVGMDGARLEQLAASIGGVGSIVRNGYMVKTWGDQTAKADWASAAKPVLNMLLFFAAQEDRIDSVEDPVAPWMLAATGGVLRAEDEAMTFAHLMNMTSGYARIEGPGAAWAYNDVAVQLKNRLVGAIFGEPLDVPLRARLARLELQDGSLLTARGGYGVSTSTRDFARIAWFWLNRGNWGGQQILAEDFFENYLRSQVPASVPRSSGPDADYLNVGSFGGPTDQIDYGPGQFGMNWWFNGPNDTVGATDLRPWHDAPPDTVLALGHWNREFVMFVPSLNVVVTARGNWGTFVPGDASSGMNERLRMLTQSVIQ